MHQWSEEDGAFSADQHSSETMVRSDAEDEMALLGALPIKHVRTEKMSES